MQDPRFGREFFGKFVCFVDTALISGLLLVPGFRTGAVGYGFRSFLFCACDVLICVQQCWCSFSACESSLHFFCV